MPADTRGAALSAGEGSVTELLQAWHEGSEAARNQVFEVTYAELRSIAAAYLRREHRGNSIQVTGLVNEAFLRLVGTRASWSDRRHFYGVAAQAMRRILVDHARRREAIKRSPGGFQVVLSGNVDVPAQEAYSTLRLDEALSDLARLDPRQAQVVELRYFGGLSVPEAAEALGISPATVKREWATARAWLARRVHIRGATP